MTSMPISSASSRRSGIGGRAGVRGRALASIVVATGLLGLGVPASAGDPVPELVRDIVLDGSASPRYLTNVAGTLFFTAVGAGGRELWKSDGTADGTVRVKDIRPGTAGSDPQQLANIGGLL